VARRLSSRFSAPLFPVVLPVAIEPQSAQCTETICATATPAHSLFLLLTLGNHQIGCTFFTDYTIGDILSLLLLVLAQLIAFLSNNKLEKDLVAENQRFHVEVPPGEVRTE
jgi:hypothetical protein